MDRLPSHVESLHFENVSFSLFSSPPLTTIASLSLVSPQKMQLLQSFSDLCTSLPNLQSLRLASVPIMSFAFLTVLAYLAPRLTSLEMRGCQGGLDPAGARALSMLTNLRNLVFLGDSFMYASSLEYLSSLQSVTSLWLNCTPYSFGAFDWLPTQIRSLSLSPVAVYHLESNLQRYLTCLRSVRFYPSLSGYSRILPVVPDSLLQMTNLTHLSAIIPDEFAPFVFPAMYRLTQLRSLSLELTDTERLDRVPSSHSSLAQLNLSSFVRLTSLELHVVVVSSSFLTAIAISSLTNLRRLVFRLSKFTYNLPSLLSAVSTLTRLQLLHMLYDSHAFREFALPDHILSLLRAPQLRDLRIGFDKFDPRTLRPYSASPAVPLGLRKRKHTSDNGHEVEAIE